MNIVAEYIWQDGSLPTHKLRSKTKVFQFEGDVSSLDVKDIPRWTFDGSSTGQATGDKSDCQLIPVRFILDPTREKNHERVHILVLNEVFTADVKPHETNTRARLREVVSRTLRHEPLFGIEQEYTMFKDGRALGWPTGGYPPQQGPFYCGVGSDEVFGRELVEEHLAACLDSHIALCGINAEVMPGQWEFQIGTADALTVSDHLIFARWLLYRIGEKHGITCRLDPKPIAELNGAGAHTNFSTKEMRAPEGIYAIKRACEKLQQRHDMHIANYGHGIELRLTGHHETCSYREFRWGVSDRGASIRIPLHVAHEMRGYLEDRRPCANVDPYVVTRLLLEAVCEEG
jgi:glutamine synthetase